MAGSDNPNEPDDTVEALKRRLLPAVRARMEGRINPDAPADMQMFQALFAELLQIENIVLSRAERQRLFDALLAEF